MRSYRKVYRCCNHIWLRGVQAPEDKRSMIPTQLRARAPEMGLYNHRPEHQYIDHSHKLAARRYSSDIQQAVEVPLCKHLELLKKIRSRWI